jgi:hypothetical protein
VRNLRPKPNFMKSLFSFVVLMCVLSHTAFAQMDKYTVRYKARQSMTSSAEKSSELSGVYGKSSRKSKQKYGKKPLFKFGVFSAAGLTVQQEAQSKQIFRYSGADIESAYQFNQKADNETATVRVSDQLELKTVKIRREFEIPVEMQYVQLGFVQLADQTNWEFFLSDHDLLKNSKQQLVGYLYGAQDEIAITRTNQSFVFTQNGKEIAVLDHPFIGCTKVQLEPMLRMDQKIAITALMSSILIKRIISE